MYVIIGSAGKVGYAVAQSLYSEGHDVAVIERDIEACTQAEALDIMVVRGNAASPESLLNAKIDEADLFIGVTGSDEVNLLACAFAKSKLCKTIARIESSDYINEPISKTKYKHVGVDVAICPEIVSGIKIARALFNPTILDAEIFARGKVQVLESVVDSNSPAAGKALKEIKFPKNSIVGAITRNSDVIVPSGDDVIHIDDRVIVFAKTDSLPKLEKLFW